MKRVCLMLLLAGMTSAGCAMLDAATGKEEVKSKVTVFVRNDQGAVHKVELKKTESGKYIGPDGKAFRSMPSDKVLAKRYGK